MGPYEESSRLIRDTFKDVRWGVTDYASSGRSKIITVLSKHGSFVVPQVHGSGFDWKTRSMVRYLNRWKNAHPGVELMPSLGAYDTSYNGFEFVPEIDSNGQPKMKKKGIHATPVQIRQEMHKMHNALVEYSKTTRIDTALYWDSLWGDNRGQKRFFADVKKARQRATPTPTPTTPTTPGPVAGGGP